MLHALALFAGALFSLFDLVVGLLLTAERVEMWVRRAA